ncbi:cytochrome P450 [Melanogaster broomeanus]|nr:cytochrome P450 [Melanogaster broomeanus]
MLLQGISTLKLEYLVGFTAAAIALVLLSKRYMGALASKGGVPLPPGPPARWFWQTAMPTKNTVLAVADLVNQYGSVVSLRQGSRVTIIIGRMDAATEIMEKEGGALVDRPHLIAAGDLLSKGIRLILAPAGERFRRLRKAVHTHLHPKAAATYQVMQTEAAKNLILDILNDPKHHMQHAERYSASVALRLSYGKSTPISRNDPEVVRGYKVIENVKEVMRPGAYLVDQIPMLRYLPGYGKKINEYHQYEIRLFRDQINRVRDEVAQNNAGPSFAKSLLENVNDHRLSADEMAYLAGALFAAGSDTTAAGITMMIMAAACHPDPQTRVQQELDLVVGSDRAPTFEDSSTLPQLHAFILEAHRWRPVAPLGLAHRATRDIIWRGQCIPAGATVYGSHWAISRDPVAFPDPEKFDPQRWLDDDGQIRPDMHFFTYGFGRRVCPGQHVANRSLYINLALLLWSFRVLERPEAPVDSHAFSGVIVAHAAPFEVDFVPRIAERKLKEMMEERM